MGIKGYATVDGARNYFDRKNIELKKTRNNGHFISLPMAMGTFLGDFSDEDSRKYEESLSYGLMNGVNFIDTAICYRGMKSEKDLGRVLKRLITEETVKREEVIVSTKAGIIFGDISVPIRPIDYLNNILLKENIVKPEEINVTEEYRHTLSPKFYEHAIEKSKKNLNLDTIDIHYIHEPEASKAIIGAEAFYSKLEDLFEFYESQVDKGNIVNYGMATYSGFIVPENSKYYISLEKIMNIAKGIAGEKHHFKFIQLKYNKTNTAANTLKNQQICSKYCTAIEAANELGINVNVNSPLNQMKAGLGEKYSAEEMIKYVLDTKGVYAAMVGSKQLQHLKDNMRCL